MKRFLTLALAIIMLLSCMLTATSCASKPKMNLEKAEENLDDEDYYVYYSDDLNDPMYKESLTAYSDDDYLSVIVFDDSKLAKIYYNGLKNEMEYKKKEIKLEIEALKRALKKYDDEYSNSEIDRMEDEIKDLKKELEELKDVVIGISGKKVWKGTKDAIKDSK